MRFAGPLEDTTHQAFAAMSRDPFFLLNRPLALIFVRLTIVVIALVSRLEQEATS